MTLEEIILLIPNYNPHTSKGDCYFDPEAANHAIEFIECYCTLSKDCTKKRMGSPFILELWQKAIIANLFGWKKPNGKRRYNECFILIGRKNGKSEIAAAIINYMAYCDKEGGAELYCCGSEMKQAKIIFDATKQMIQNNPSLSSRSKIMQYKIEYPLNAKLTYLSADAKTKDGYNAHLVVFDELSAYDKRELVDVLTTSQGSKAQPLILYTTTTDYSRPSIYWEVYKRAKQAAEAKGPDDIGFNCNFLPVIYEAQPNDNIQSVDTWKEANPNLNVSVMEDFLLKESQKALATPSYENTFKMKYLNIATEQARRWISIQAYDLCNQETIDVATLKDEDCYLGMDLSSTTDITAIVLFFPKVKLFIPYFWVPEANAHKRQLRDKVPYLTWEKQGLITLTEGNVVDYEVVKAKIIELSNIYNIKEIAYDPWNATQIALQLQEKGFKLIEFRQGDISFSEPSKEFERLITLGELKFNKNPIMRWMIGNVAIKERKDGSLIRPSKEMSTEKIDGVVAAIMALGRAMLSNEFKSIYSDMEVLIV